MNLPKNYEPNQYEADIYALWEKSEAFKPVARGSKQTFSIVMPPPNANGDLHLGHGLTLAVEDVAIRYHRMRGKKTLFLPGADHAGFETQVVYERQLAKQGKSRFDFTRQELYDQIYEFVAQNRGNYESQFRRTGASLDWDHYTYTLDKKIIDRAYATFKKMWDDKLIYRGERLINYCTFHGTGFADIEIEHKEVKGHIWHLRYPLTDGSGEVVVATTRPETMLGDVAVSVHPDDKRYQSIVGKTVRLPLTNREIPVIADSFVDPNFGTGAVKITPAHDMNDYEAGERHDLPRITVIGFDGKINHNAPEAYQGLTVKEAREAVVRDLDKLDNLVKTENHTNNVGHCYKCGTVIEPLLKEQWFIDMKPLAKRAIEALEAGKVTFYPDNRRGQLVRYLEGLRDWNISRQIAWGIPIPAFQNADKPEEWIFDERVDQEIIEVNGSTYHRDPDVFDTWFSSGSWPYATLDFPDSQDFKDFYPLSLMETGADILFPWVSRMLMLGLYITGDVPFKEVYLHGIILDPQGAKMSKSKGNVVNPIEKIDTFGADAFRMGIITDESPSSRRPYDESKLVGARNFCNKLWNIARYIEGELGDELRLDAPAQPKTPSDHWVLHQLNEAIEAITAHLENYRFSEAYELLYHTVWDDVADWYIEASKEALNASVLNNVLQTILKLAHPFAPFLTETIWQTLQPDTDSLLITSSWPEVISYDQERSAEFEKVKLLVSEVRQIKTVLQLKGGVLSYTDAPFIVENAQTIQKLARLDSIDKGGGEGVRLTRVPEACWLNIDTQAAAEVTNRLQERQTGVKAQIELLGKRLDNEAYLAKAPEQLVAQSREQLAGLKEELATIEEQLELFR